MRDMSVLLILIMALAAIMLTIYFIASVKKTRKWLVAFRVSIFALTILLSFSFIFSIIKGQPAFILLLMAALFGVLCAFSPSEYEN